MYLYAASDPNNIIDISGMSVGGYWDTCYKAEWDHCADHCKSIGESLISCAVWVGKRYSGVKQGFVDNRNYPPSCNCTGSSCAAPFLPRDDKYRKQKNANGGAGISNDSSDYVGPVVVGGLALAAAGIAIAGSSTVGPAFAAAGFVGAVMGGNASQ